MSPMSQEKIALNDHPLPERLKIARTRLGLTQTALAKLTGYSLSAIGNWESRQNFPSPSKLGHLATKLGVSIDYLLGHDNGPGFRVRLSPKQLPETIREVPIVSWAQAGELKAYLDLDAAWHDFTVTTCKDENCFAVTIAGDSMEPKYNGGDLAILMPNVEPRNGCLVVFKLKNEGVFFKMFQVTPDSKKFRMTSYNPLYQVMDVKKDDFVWIYPVYQVIKNVWK